MHKEIQQHKSVDFTQVKYVHLKWSQLKSLASFFPVSRQVDYLPVLFERITKWESPGEMQWVYIIKTTLDTILHWYIADQGNKISEILSELVYDEGSTLY